MNYTIKELEENDLIIFSAIMGSNAYGTSLPTSDKDVRGVFMQPLADILKYGYAEQTADDNNDIIYYELRRFLLLAAQNNPNILELLFSPKDCVIKTSDEWRMIQCHANEFLTKKCKYTFAGYAIDQIKKAKGYNKKINWEESKLQRKSVLDFCYILVEGGTKKFKEWAKDLFTQERFGLANIEHSHDIYAMYDLNEYDVPKGIVSNEETANDVQLTSIPKGISPIAYLAFNKDAYSIHCKNYNEYKKWLKERNEDRFKMNKKHGKNYDSKNMMHTFRLLNVSIEIARTGNLIVRRSNEEIKILMKIRNGEFEFDNLINDAEQLISKIDEVYENSSLPKQINNDFINELLYSIRIKKYKL